MPRYLFNQDLLDLGFEGVEAAERGPDGKPLLAPPGHSSGLWRVAGVPHKGWECVAVERNEERQTCEMCQEQFIVWVHTMRHPDYPEPLEVGCICAGAMEQDYEGARKRESRAKAAYKRAQMATHLWQGAMQSRWQNLAIHEGRRSYSVKIAGFRLWAWERRGGFLAGMHHKRSGYRRKVPTPFKTLAAAKLAAVNMMVRAYKAQPWQQAGAW